MVRPPQWTNWPSVPIETSEDEDEEALDCP